MKKFFPLVIVINAIILGCKPKDQAALEKGMRYELEGRTKEAATEYAKAASLGNPDGFIKLGDLRLSCGYPKASNRDESDYVHGCDRWLANAKDAIDNAREYYDRAEGLGAKDSVGIQRGKKRLKERETEVLDIQGKVNAAKENERIRQSEERRLREERAKKEREEREEKARLARIEQEKRNAAEQQDREKMLQIEKDRRDADARAAHSELQRRKAWDDIDRCITNGSEMSAQTFCEFVKLHQDVNGPNMTGKKVVVSGVIEKVQTTFFTSQPKCIINAHGNSISARFDGMLKSEAAEKLFVGKKVTIEGNVSLRVVVSNIAMDNCKLR